MEIKWDFTSKLSDSSVFEKIEKEYSFIFSDELKSIFNQYNYGYPKPNLVKVNGRERVFASLLSLNEEDSDFIPATIENLEFFVDGKLLMFPFAVDPFGNYFCVENDKIVFWSHEDNETVVVADSLHEFFTLLY